MSDNLKYKYNITEVSLVYKHQDVSKDRPKVQNTKDCYDILKRVWDENTIELLEEFKIVLLDRSLSCLGVAHIATGGITGCVVDPRIIFATALKSRATGIVLAHNHPSGNLQPSQADIDINEKLTFAGAVLDINVHDHLILSSEGYYSFQSEGLMPHPRCVF